MANTIFYVTFFINLVLRGIGIIISTLLLYVSWRIKLLQKPGLYLVHLLITLDLVYFVTAIPHLIYCVVNYDAELLNYNPMIIYFTGIPNLFHDKNELTLLIAIAADRLIAVYSPATYQLINHKQKTVVIFLFSCLAGCSDVFLMYALSPLKEHINCAALGCFMSDDYRELLGLGNGALGVFLMFLTLILLRKLKRLSQECANRTRTIENANFVQANKTAAITLVTCGLLFTIPMSIMAMFQTYIGWLMKAIGPCYSILIILSGILNCLTLLMRNKEFNRGIRNLLSNKVTPTFTTDLQRPRSATTATR